jgi:hypothetical protein
MFKKVILFSFSLLLLNFALPEQKANANAPLALGIVGTALGGTALGLGALNSYQLYRQRRDYNRNYYDNSYYAPASQGYYDDSSYYAPVQDSYYYDDCNDYGYDY